MKIPVEKICLDFICHHCNCIKNDVELWDVIIAGIPMCCDEEMSVEGDSVTIKEETT